MTILIVTLRYAFDIYYFLILANILLSWIPVNKNNPLIRFVHETTEPYLRIFRRILPVSPKIPIDFSPILAIFVLYFIESIAFRLLGMLI